MAKLRSKVRLQVRKNSTRAGTPEGGLDIQDNQHQPVTACRMYDLVSARIEPVNAEIASDPLKLLLLRFSLVVSGFRLKCFTWTSAEEVYVFYERPRHAELFLLLRSHGYHAKSWAM